MTMLWPTLTVEDVDASISFYRDKLSFASDFSLQDANGKTFLGTVEVGDIDGRTTRHAGYQVSQQKRKRIEEIFGWLKTVGLLRKLRHRGTARVNWIFIFATAAYNLVRMRKLVTV